MDVTASFIPDPQPLELMQPGDRAFHHPAVYAETAAMLGAPPRQHRSDAAPAQLAAVWVTIIGPVTLYQQRAPSWSATFAAHRRDRLDERHQLGHVMGRGTRQSSRQRDALRFDNQVVLASSFGPIRRVRAGLEPPFRDRTEELSTTARDQSRLSASCSFASSSSCNRCHTPAACQSRSLRQQVIPEPQPISCGRSSHEMPVRKTKRMPVSACRWLIGLRPGKRRRRGGGAGKTGSITPTAHH